jgi:hypothetical protein
MAHAIIRGKNGRRHEVDFGDSPVRVAIYASEETVEIFVGADFETHVPRRDDEPISVSLTSFCDNSLWHLITGQRSLASTTSHQTIKGAKIGAGNALRKIIRGLEHREFFRNRTDDELVQRRAILASNLLDRSFERSR